MSDWTSRGFGILIAYVIPGFLALWGVSLYSPSVRLWLSGVEATGPTAGGIPYALLASVAAGMTASVVRWAVLDTVHAWTGLKRPLWDDTTLVQRLDIYRFFIEIHYRYYQFYGNSIVAGAFSYTAWRFTTGVPWMFDLSAILLTCVFFAGSRDTLRLYYRRTALLLGEKERKACDDQRRKAPSLPHPRTPHSQGAPTKPDEGDAQDERRRIVYQDFDE